MPGYKTHLIGGLLTFILLVVVLRIALPPYLVAEWLTCALLGSLFPDVDTKSKGQKVFYRVLAILYIFLAIFQRWASIILLSFMALLPLLVGHRGIFHSAWFVALIGVCTTVYSYIYFPALAYTVAWDSLFFVAGAWSHLMLDRGVVGAFKW